MSSAIFPGVTTLRSTTSTAAVRILPEMRESIGKTSGCRLSGCFVSVSVLTNFLSSKSGGSSEADEGRLVVGLFAFTGEPMEGEPAAERPTPVSDGADAECVTPEPRALVAVPCDIAMPAAFNVWLSCRWKAEGVTLGSAVVFAPLRPTTCFSTGSAEATFRGNSFGVRSSDNSLWRSAKRRPMASLRMWRFRGAPAVLPRAPPGVKSPHMICEGETPSTCAISSSSMRWRELMWASP
mmetsp:Transcript_43554/g.125922  ORF Transcript_43554/g.125922 Transcript_43554/m.125922 type:complete len:238 (-) Transcript_43554:1064-1777(-)